VYKSAARFSQHQNPSKPSFGSMKRLLSGLLPLAKARLAKRKKAKKRKRTKKPSAKKIAKTKPKTKITKEWHPKIESIDFTVQAVPRPKEPTKKELREILRQAIENTERFQKGWPLAKKTDR
jgi:hypothetical protein